MTDQELEKEIAASMDRLKKWWNSLSKEEQMKEAEKVENSRLWEDWTECDCVASSKVHSSKTKSDH